MKLSAPSWRALALSALAASASAAPAAPLHPLRPDHPLIGAWKITTRDGSCDEIYRIDRGGTALVTSADEVAQTRFEISDRPSARGYYKWVDTLVRDNGKKDCSGQVTHAPRTTVSYLLLNDAGDRFVMCSAEDGRRCIGPFVKMTGGEI